MEVARLIYIDVFKVQVTFFFFRGANFYVHKEIGEYILMAVN